MLRFEKSSYFPENVFVHFDLFQNLLFCKSMFLFEDFNPLNANPTKWSDTLKQFLLFS